MDKGPWIVNDRTCDRIDSDDFTHDASLILYGDFKPEDRLPYLRFIAKELNDVTRLRSLAARAGDIEGMAKVMYYLDAPKAPQGTWEKFTVRLKQPYLETAAAVSKWIRGE